MQRSKLRVGFVCSIVATILVIYWVSLAFKPKMHIPVLPEQSLSTQHKQPLDNFKDYPCLYDAMPTDDLKKKDQCVRTPLFSSVEITTDWCIILKIGTPICTHDPRHDLISEYVHKERQWENDLIDKMYEVFKRTPNMMLFDVGSNIGVYCISAAFYHRHVVCLDANYENLWKLSQSLQRGQLTENATLIWNAVSNNHTTIHFHIAEGNIGMSRIADLKLWKTETAKNMSVNSIMLDDLQDFSKFKNKPLFMKMDVEAHELYVLQGAEKFFKKVDVRIIQMELTEKATKLAVIELLEKYGFSVYRDPLGADKLMKFNALNGWPGDIYFLRNK